MDGIAGAVQRWFPEEFNQYVAAMKAPPPSMPEGHIEQAVQAFLPPPIPLGSRDAWERIVDETEDKLRNCLHRAELKAYYFDMKGRHTIPREFWVTDQADGTLKRGLSWPFGYSLFFLELELEALLSERPAKKRNLPLAKMPEVVLALRQLDHLPNRKAQFQALCALKEFREFKITIAIFREAARRLPRNPGRKSRRES